MYYSVLHSVSDVADLDRIPAVSRRGYPHRETEIGRETEKEIVIVIAIAIAIANEIEIATYCPDIDRQSDHLLGQIISHNIHHHIRDTVCQYVQI